MKELSTKINSEILDYYDECIRKGSKIPPPHIVAADVVKSRKVVVVLFSNNHAQAVNFDEFAPTNVQPDFSDIEIVDHGQTLRLGRYEAAADALFNLGLWND